ncbi:hypothetical protein DSM104299_05469 [Baekduia alba]|uniref:hypothetical protein n=1 Tax=Baekduia alba TaxID=2997333 RepID=UPI0023410778|nr:hypothetical protein [Baekduia alba]WCB96703.1 hypothetical protein DSM104299_05469 [Baekduia alba]
MSKTTKHALRGALGCGAALLLAGLSSAPALASDSYLNVTKSGQYIGHGYFWDSPTGSSCASGQEVIGANDTVGSDGYSIQTDIWYTNSEGYSFHLSTVATASAGSTKTAQKCVSSLDDGYTVQVRSCARNSSGVLSYCSPISRPTS